MVVAEELEPLDKLIIAINKRLDGKYTVSRTPGEYRFIYAHRIAVIDNASRILESIVVPRGLVEASRDDSRLRTKIVDILSTEAARAITSEGVLA